MDRPQALEKLQAQFTIKLPPGYSFDFGPTDTWDAGGETYWFDDDKKRWGKVRISEYLFQAYNYNAYDIAATMVHEAVHAWQLYSLEVYGESGVFSGFPNFKPENPYYRTFAWAKQYAPSLELQAEEYVETHIPQPLCVSDVIKENIERNKRQYSPITIPGLEQDRVPLLGRPLP